MTDENTMTIQDLLLERHRIGSEIYKNREEIRILEKRKRAIRKILYEICNHNWEREFSNCGPYSETCYRCSICGVYH